jgi:hypothetical protein
VLDKTNMTAIRTLIRYYLSEHGAFGRGSGITLDQTASPHNSLLGKMPYSDADEEDEEETDHSISNESLECNR